MIPTKDNWKNYSPLEKAAYIAALCAVITLPLSILFWYKSNSDTEDTTQQRHQEFLEANRPIIELEKIEIVRALRKADGHLRFYFKNTGNIEARDICFGIYEPFDRDGKPIFSNNTLAETCTGENSFPRFRLRKDGEISIPFPLLNLPEIQRRIGFIPNSASIQKGQPYQNLFLFNVFYKDTAGTEFRDMFPFEFYRQESPNN